ncbi:MAG: 4Fe-4S cluster-binding domain-containing protein [Butyricimonas faecihominis]
MRCVDLSPKVIGIARHRLQTDWQGVSTLVAFHGCPLHCRYCLNPQSLNNGRYWKRYDCRTLYEEVKVDELYFLATGGGVTFGRGTVFARAELTGKFRELCGKEWLLTVETSLNVGQEYVEHITPGCRSFYY